MKTNIFTLIFLLAGRVLAGGSVIGNGAGLVENNFQFAYQSLHGVFSECIVQVRCELTENETWLVKNMRKVIEQNRLNEERLIFVSEKDHPGFFKTGDDEEHRVAKTGLTADTPIYVNTDLLYTADGNPAFDYPTVISVLVHELGHQCGETNHAKLDIIGAKIKKFVLSRSQSYPLQLDGERIEVSILNRNFPFRISEINISWQNVGGLNATRLALQGITCNNPGNSLAGIEILNGHYTFFKKSSSQKTAHFGFGFWAALTCYSEDNENFLQEQKQIEIEVTRSFEIKILQVYDL